MMIKTLRTNLLTNILTSCEIHDFPSYIDLTLKGRLLFSPPPRSYFCSSYLPQRFLKEGLFLMTPPEIVTADFLLFLALVFEWGSGSNLAILFRNAGVVRSMECY